MTNTDKDKFTAIAHDDDFRNGYASRTTWAEILEPHGGYFWAATQATSAGNHLAVVADRLPVLPVPAAP